MKVLEPFEKQYKSRTSFDASAATSGLYDLSTIFGIEFFQNSTVFPRSIRIEGQARDMITRLEQMRDLKDGWNAYGAEIPSPEAIKYAVKFIVDNIQYGLPYYFVAPGVNGEVMIELKEGDRTAEIYFWEDHSTELLLLENEKVALEGTLKMDYQKLLQFF